MVGIRALTYLGLMANRRDSDHCNNDGSDDINNPVLTRAKFLDFCDENQQFRDSTQQTLDQIQAALATLLNWNPNCDDEERRDNRARGPPHRGPNQNRQQDYNKGNSDDKEYAERVLGNYRGLVRDNGQDYQEQKDYWMKVELWVMSPLKSIWIRSVRRKSFLIIWVLQMKKRYVWWPTNWRETHLLGGIVFNQTVLVNESFQYEHGGGWKD